MREAVNKFLVDGQLIFYSDENKEEDPLWDYSVDADQIETNQIVNQELKDLAQTINKPQQVKESKKKGAVKEMEI